MGETLHLTLLGKTIFVRLHVKISIFFTDSATFHANNVLWDGKNCGTHGDCCTRLSHPYFVKQLEKPTTDDIDLRMCVTGTQDVALELVEIFIQ